MWEAAPLRSPDNQGGRVVWSCFIDVVLLNQHKWELDDPIYHALLRKIRRGKGGLTDVNDDTKLFQSSMRTHGLFT